MPGAGDGTYYMFKNEFAYRTFLSSSVLTFCSRHHPPPPLPPQPPPPVATTPTTTKPFSPPQQQTQQQEHKQYQQQQQQRQEQQEEQDGQEDPDGREEPDKPTRITMRTGRTGIKGRTGRTRMIGRAGRAGRTGTTKKAGRTRGTRRTRRTGRTRRTITTKTTIATTTARTTGTRRTTRTKIFPFMIFPLPFWCSLDLSRSPVSLYFSIPVEVILNSLHWEVAQLNINHFYQGSDLQDRSTRFGSLRLPHAGLHIIRKESGWNLTILPSHHIMQHLNIFKILIWSLKFQSWSLRLVIWLRNGTRASVLLPCP